jgi:hypothetical protein
MTVQSYTFESAMFHILHEKVPRIALGALIDFWKRKGQRYIYSFADELFLVFLVD